jgi:hypothetical protein
LYVWHFHTSHQESMSRDFREARNVFSQLVQRFTPATLGFLILLVVAGGVFAYQVSPLRDSSFQPNSANAGSLIPWMRGVDDNTWFQGSSVLAGLLAINLVLIIRQRIQSITNAIPRFLRLAFWTMVGVIFFLVIELAFVFYLLGQWLMD